jgi:hypothetical protein
MDLVIPTTCFLLRVLVRLRVNFFVDPASANGSVTPLRQLVLVTGFYGELMISTRADRCMGYCCCRPKFVQVLVFG